MSLDGRPAAANGDRLDGSYRRRAVAGRWLGPGAPLPFARASVAVAVLAAAWPALAAEEPVAEGFATADSLRGEVVFRPRGEQTAMRASDARLETVLATLAARGLLQMNFHCADPSAVKALLDRREVATTPNEMLEQVLGDDWKATFGVEADLDKPLPVDIAPTEGECDVTGEPLRSFYPGGQHPLLVQGSDESIDEETYRRIMRSAGPESRRRAVLRIRVARGDEGAIEMLMSALDDPDVDTAVIASRLLGRAGRRMPAAQRAEVGARFAATVERRGILEMAVSAGNYRGDSAWRLIEAIIGSGHENATDYAVRSLVTSRDPRGIPWLETVVRSTETEEQARQAMWAIARTATPLAATTLAAMLDDASLPLARRAFAAQGLSKVGDSPEAEGARAKLMALLKSDDTSVNEVRSFAEALTEAQFADPMRDMLGSAEASESKKLAVVSVLGSRGGPAVIPALAAAASDSSAELRLQMARALQQVAHPDSEPVFLELAKDESADVRAASLYGLTRLASEARVTQQLVRSLEDPSEQVRLAAIQTLARIDTMTKIAQEGIEGALESDDPKVAELALEILETWALR